MKEQERVLLEKLTQLQDLLVRYGHRSRLARGPMGNPYRGQGRILKLLRLTPEISQRDLLDLLDMRPQSLGELLGKLERDGYITRTPLEEDRRVMMIRLTEKGVCPQEAPDETDLLDCLTGEEQVILEGYLDRMIARLEQVVAEMGPAPHEPPPPHHGPHHGLHEPPPPPHGPHHGPHGDPPLPPGHRRGTWEDSGEGTAEVPGEPQPHKLV